MVINFGAIVCHNQNVRIVLLSVIVKRVKKDAQTVPVVVGAEDGTFGAYFVRVPDGHAVGTHTATTVHAQHGLYFPVGRLYRIFRPDATFLAANGRRETNLIVRRNRTTAVLPERNGAVLEHQVRTFEAQLVLESFEHIAWRERLVHVENRNKDEQKKNQPQSFHH